MDVEGKKEGSFGESLGELREGGRCCYEMQSLFAGLLICNYAYMYWYIDI